MPFLKLGDTSKVLSGVQKMCKSMPMPQCNKNCLSGTFQLLSLFWSVLVLSLALTPTSVQSRILSAAPDLLRPMLGHANNDRMLDVASSTSSSPPSLCFPC
jgi:hypothetical protein